jgi:hypothetical protein
VVPLLNGIDHVGRLREFFRRRVVPATISVESERVAPGAVAESRMVFCRSMIGHPAPGRESSKSSASRGTSPSDWRTGLAHAHASLPRGRGDCLTHALQPFIASTT